MAEEVLLASIRAEQAQFRRELQEASRAVERMSTDAARAVGRLDQTLQLIAGSARQFGVALAATGVLAFVQQVGQLAAAAVQTANQFAGFTLALKNATGGLREAQQALAFVRQEATRMGVDVTQAVQGFTALANATKNTTLAGAATREIFRSLSEASRVLGLSTDQYGRALTAISQIATKGRVQQEELLQLAEAGIPVYGALSRALGKTTEELAKMLEQGQVSRDVLLPLARELRQELGGSATEAGQAFAAAQTRMSNAVTGMLEALGRLITESPTIRGAIDGITTSVNALTRAVETYRRGGLSGEAMRQELLAPLLGASGIRQEELTREELARLLGRQPGAPAGETPQQALEDVRKAVEARRQAVASAGQAAIAAAGFPTGIGPSATAEEARERVRQLARKTGTSAEEEGQAFLNELQKAEQERKRIEQERKRADAEARQAARAREHATETATKAIIALTTDQFETERQLIAGTVADFRKAKVDETTIATFEAAKRQDIVRREVEAGLKALDDDQRAREDAQQAETDLTQKAAEERQKIAEAITAVEARESKSRADDFTAQLARQRAVLVEHHATADDLRRFDVAAQAAVHRLEVDETAKALREQEREYERTFGQIQRTIADTFVGLLDGTIQGSRDLLDSLKQYALRIFADIAATAVVRLGGNLLASILGVAGGAAGLLGGAGGASGGAAGGGGGDIFSTLLGLGQQANSISGALGGPTVQSSLGLTGQGGTFGNLLGSTLFTIGGSGAGGGATLIGAGGGLTTAGLASSGLVGGAALGSGATLGGAIGGTAGSFTVAGGGSLGLTGGGGGLLAGSGGAAAGGTAVTLGTAATGVGAGLAAGFALNEFNKFIGIDKAIGSRGSAALAGAGGGAVAGSIILPGIGTAIGAVLGALLGGLLGGGGSSRQPAFGIRNVQTPEVGFQPGVGVTFGTGLGIEPSFTNIPRAIQPKIQQGLRDATEAAFDGITTTLRQLPTALQERAVPQIQALTDEIALQFENIRFKGKDAGKAIEKFIAEGIPQTFTDVFGPFIEQLQRVAPLIQQLDQAVSALEQRQAALLATLGGARQALTEALFTPAQLFETRVDELRTLANSVNAATPEALSAAAPRIAALTQEVFRLAEQEQVFGDDLDALKTLQKELIGILDKTEADTRTVFQDAIAATREQRDILLSSFQVQETIGHLMNQAVQHLQTLTALLQPVGSFQTLPGQVHQIPRTGLGLVHAGELIGRPAGGTFAPSISVTVQVPAGSNGHQIGAQVGEGIAQTIRQLQQRSRYRQDRFL